MSENRARSSLKGWYRRGDQHPPHFDGGYVPQYVTFRLAGTLPANLLATWEKDLIERRIRSEEFHLNIEKYLDRGIGECWLKDGRIATVVRYALLHFDGIRYDLYGWVLMPNHVHVLFSCRDGYTLPSVIHAWKSFTAKQANEILRRSGCFWQDDYFDRYVRNERQFLNVLDYIESNPVRAGLCQRVDDWEFVGVCWVG